MYAAKPPKIGIVNHNKVLSSGFLFMRIIITVSINHMASLIQIHNGQVDMLLKPNLANKPKPPRRMIKTAIPCVIPANFLPFFI